MSWSTYITRQQVEKHLQDEEDLYIWCPACRDGYWLDEFDLKELLEKEEIDNYCCECGTTYYIGLEEE